MITGPVLRGGDGVHVLGAAGAGRHSQVQLDPREGCTRKKSSTNQPCRSTLLIQREGRSMSWLHFWKMSSQKHNMNCLLLWFLLSLILLKPPLSMSILGSSSPFFVQLKVSCARQMRKSIYFELMCLLE